MSKNSYFRRMSIWLSDYELEEVAKKMQVNMVAHLGIEITDLGEDYLAGTMPVDCRTQQPFGILHGGASCVLAETLGSIAANLVVDPKVSYCLGLDINTNHLRAVRSGIVTGIARPIHLGRKTQVWEIKIHDSKENLVSISRLTMMIMSHK